MRKTMTTVALAALLATGLSAQAALIDLSNGMVYDDVTQLTWAKAIQTTGQDWASANTAAAAYGLGGLTWRLPKLTQSPPCLSACNGQHSELADMFFRNLGFQSDTAPSPLSTPLFGSLDVINGTGGHDVYWLADAFAADIHYTYVFNYENSGTNIYGNHSYGGDIGQWGAWFVTDEYVYEEPSDNGNRVPLPGSLLLAGAGLVALGAARRRRVLSA